MKYDDDDGPELTAEIMATAKRGRDVFPEEVLSQFKRGRGRPKADATKIAVSIRLDRRVVEQFKATGEGWQTRINDTLARSLDEANNDRAGRTPR